MKRILAFTLSMVLLAGILPESAHAEETPAEKLLAEMSLGDKITQMLMVSVTHWDEDPADETEAVQVTELPEGLARVVEDYNFGSVIYLAQNLTGTEQAYRLTADLQRAAVKDGGIPMLIAADQEGGNVYRLATGTALPGNLALGAAGEPEYALRAGRVIGSELSVLGINTNLAPVVDVNSNAANPVIGLRSYGDDPELVGRMASAAIRGMEEYNVIGCAKHFPGHGDTATDSHYGLPMVDKSLEQLRQCELKPFEIAIDQGVDMIMTAHILYPQLEQGTALSHKTGQAEALPATMSRKILTELLKEDMGFDGIVVTDAMNMAGITDFWDPVQAVVLSVQAGADMICMPCAISSPESLKDLDAIIQGVTAAVEDGTVPMSRIDDAVRRILTVKQERGILRWSEAEYSLEAALNTVGCEENRAVERYIAAAAVTVVENKNNTLPLRMTSQSKVLMLVPYDNEQAQMILGWNRAAEAGLIPEGAEVQVLRFSKDSSLSGFLPQIDWADTLIFNSEIGVAGRMFGGRWESAFILEALNYAEAAGKTTVVQSVDKPYDVQSYPNADAVLAVYGCKGSSMDPTEALVGGVTNSETAFGPNIVAGIEVILGVFGAGGTLPVDIPKYENGAYTEEILYPRGYGIRYDSLSPEPELPPITEETQPQTQPEELPETTVQPQPALPVEQTKQTPSPFLIAGAAALAAVLLILIGRSGKRRR